MRNCKPQILYRNTKTPDSEPNTFP